MYVMANKIAATGELEAIIMVMKLPIPPMSISPIQMKPNTEKNLTHP